MRALREFFSSSLQSLIPLLLAACSTTTSTTTAGPAPIEPAPPIEETPDAGTPDPRLEGRPFTVRTPKGYDGSKPLPLLFAFHGYGSDDDGKTLERFFRFAKVADTEGFLYVTPDGVKDSRGQRFWNATDACCDFDEKRPEDVGYIRAVVADVGKRFNLDTKRVYAFGLSGGGFFAHRLACDAADVFAGVASMSGATWNDAARCQPTEPVAVVEIHGDADDVVGYDGGTFFEGNPPFPSAKTTIARWAASNGCGATLEDTETRYDILGQETGAETRVARHACTKGAAELWTVEDGPHAPAISPDFAPTLWTFFAAHPKP
jgi:polyhydroxybutyrate depolymerase